MDVQYEYEIPPKLKVLYDTTSRYICIDGGRGSAKSWSVAQVLLDRGMEKKSRILNTREVQNTIKDSVYKLYVDIIDACKLYNFYTVKADSIIGANGTEFIFKGLLRNTNDIKSMEGIDYCWVEEAQSVSRASLETLVPTIRKENSQIIFTYNPTNDDDPVHVDYKLSQRPDCLNITINYDENPFFPLVLRAEMEYDRAHDMDKYYHVWCGQTVKHSMAQVFYGKWAVEDFETPANQFFYFGADWGFSQDPTVLIRCYIADKNLYVDQETYGHGIDIDKIPDMFRQLPESTKYAITADSARPETISYVYHRGFPLIQSSLKGKGSIEDGIAFVRSFEKIIIHSRCKHTIDEFRTYSYKIDPITGAISNKLEDKNNHCFVGDTSILTKNGNVKIKDIKVGDIVLTRNGYKRVIKKFDNGIKKVKAYRFCNNKSLTCTDTHMIISDSGSIPAKDVTAKNILYIWSDSLFKIIKTRNTRRSFLTACLIDVIQTAKEEATGFISRLLYARTERTIVNIYMLQFTNTDTGKYQTGIMYTIKMAIHSTMILIILILLIAADIFLTMPKIIIKKINKQLNDILKKYAHLQKNGIEAKRATNGMLNTVKAPLRTLRKRNIRANNAGINISQTQSQQINFVQTSVKQNGDMQADSMILLKFARYAINHLKQINMERQQHALDHVQTGFANVYNIMVEGQHEYFANGVLVENCIDAIRYSLEKFYLGSREELYNRFGITA